MLTICLGKSTYARCGIIVNVTPLEPEWEGHVTLEFSNTTPLPAKIYANEGVAQMLFFESDEVCETSYKDRGGKYQGQQGVTLAEGADGGARYEAGARRPSERLLLERDQLHLHFGAALAVLDRLHRHVAERRRVPDLRHACRARRAGSPRSRSRPARTAS